MSDARRKLAHLAETVVEAPGELAPAARGAAFALGAGHGATAALPDDLRSFAEKVAGHAWATTDEEVRALLAAGRSEDDVFELIVATAVGAGTRRLERGLAAITEAGAA